MTAPITHVGQKHYLFEVPPDFPNGGLICRHVAVQVVQAKWLQDRLLANLT